MERTRERHQETKCKSSSGHIAPHLSFQALGSGLDRQVGRGGQDGMAEHHTHLSMWSLAGRG